MLDLLRPAVVAPVLLCLTWLLYEIKKIIRPFGLPDLPIVGAQPGDWFPLLQARWRNTKNYQAVADEIDALYKEKPCLVPIGGSESIVLLPASETQHIVDQSDAVLNMPQPMIQGLQFKYTVVNQLVVDEPLHLKIVTSNLTHQIAYLMEDVLDETEYAFAQTWGNDNEFKDVGVFDSMRRIIGAVSNRAFVGLPVCRNPGLVDAGTSYAQALPAEAGKIRMYPGIMKPLIAPFFTKGTKKHTKAFGDILKPEIEKRIKELDEYMRDPEKNPKPEHNDFLQWSIVQARGHSDPRMASPSTLAGRILMINFGAIHTTSFTLTHAIFDIFASQPAYIAALREEITSALASHGGWTKKALAQMDKVDSVIRESLRLNMASTFGVPRLVIARDGFTTRSGVHVRQGNIVAVPGKNIAKDDTFYEDAKTFRPFRFAEGRRDKGVEYVQRAKQAAATTTPEFLPFGHGRHACPGRFFAVSEMKLILGYLLVNYEVEMLKERPADLYIGAAKLPPLAAKIRVRRTT